MKNHSDEVHQLNQLVVPYQAKKVIAWNEPAKQQFYRVRDIIHRLPRLFFVDDEPGSVIKLYTDASDYGIGGHLTQTLPDGTVHDIAFVSKSLDRSQLGWSTIDKEAYAIFYCVKKLSYLLRDCNS